MSAANDARDMWAAACHGNMRAALFFLEDLFGDESEEAKELLNEFANEFNAHQSAFNELVAA